MYTGAGEHALAEEGQEGGIAIREGNYDSARGRERHGRRSGGSRFLGRICPPRVSRSGGGTLGGGIGMLCMCRGLLVAVAES